MKKYILLFLVSTSLFLSSCVREEIPYTAPIVDAAITYNWYNYNYYTSIEGEITNYGETYIHAVEVMVTAYDDAGFILDQDWFWIDVGLEPFDFTSFYIDLPIEYAAFVEVDINRID